MGLFYDALDCTQELNQTLFSLWGKKMVALLQGKLLTGGASTLVTFKKFRIP